MQRIFLFLTFLFFVSVGLFSGEALGQSLNSSDLSQVRVEDLSDDQIRSYMRQAEAAGLSEADMERLALERGMPPSEMSKLRERVERLGGGRTSSLGTRTGRSNERRFLDTSDTFALDDVAVLDTLSEAEKAFNEFKLRIFGASLFQGVTPVFEPSLQIATPKNYVIGPGDQLLIDIYGRSEENHSLMVTPEGVINIPYVGIVSVSGMTIEQATERIRSQMSTVYSAIRTGTTKVDVALGNIRSIKVTVTGEIVKPGTYTLPSLASAYNALYYSGGPTANGSFRNVSLIRGGKVIANLDIYDVLMNGTFNDNIRLEDQDVLMVPPYENRIEFNGRVKRPAIFELKEGETFDDLLRYAGGFTEDAYTARVKVIKYTDRQRRIEDVLSTQFGHYQPQTGDKYMAERILDRFENRVVIHGSVFRPGEYELSPGLTLSMLIKKAEGVQEDAFLNRGIIVRLKDDFQTEQLSFNVSGLLAGTEPDIELKREDVVTISSIFDLREEYSVDIDGEIRSPGQFPYAEGMTLQDLIIQAGGFRESASSRRIEVSRRAFGVDIMSQSAQIAEIFQVDANRGLSKAGQDFVLMPFDKVVIRTATGYEAQKTVRIEGEVLYPGPYTITRKDERISDIIKRAGGFTPFAYIDGASLKRGGKVDSDTVTSTAAEKAEIELRQLEEQNRRLRLQQFQSDANVGAELALQRHENNDFVGINLERIVKRPGQRGDLILEDGDIIHVPKELQTVKISGEVLAPSTAVYAPSKGFKQYISQAGGFSSRALRKSSYVLYANGSVKSTNRFLFFNNYPPIKPGAEIFVPQKENRPPMSPQQWLGLGTGAASLAAIIMTMLR